MLNEDTAKRAAPAPATFFPPPGGGWPLAAPEFLGMAPEPLREAAAFAEAHDSQRWPREMVNEAGQYHQASMGDRPEWAELIGPVKARGGPNGLVLRRGHLVAEWGDIDRVDMTFSISKSYLALIAGLAVEDGLIRNLNDPVRGYGLDNGFEEPHNQNITWQHLLNQTSEWEGTLWGKPDLADRNRAISGDDSLRGTHRELQPPGTHWEYNDVRVNRLSLSLLRLFRRPLTDVLRERVMNPIGASDRWEWPAYRNANVEIDGRSMAAIPGGGHWGGGLWIGSRDHARMGLLVQNGGVWDGRRILSGATMETLRLPAEGNPTYGSLWWLNAGRALLPEASEQSLLCRGGGANLIWIEPEHDLVVVSRWVDSDHWAELTGLILSSLRS